MGSSRVPREDRRRRTAARGQSPVTASPDTANASFAGDDGERPQFAPFNNIPGFVAVVSPKGVVEFVNRQMADYFGAPVEDLERWATADWIHPDDFQRVTDGLARAFAAGTPCDLEQRMRRSDGSYRWFQSRATPSRDATGRIINWCFLITDIDEWKRADEAVLASERRLKLVIDTTPAQIWTTNPDGKTESVNQHFLDYVGCTLEELQESTWGVIVHPDDHPAISALWKSLQAAGVPGEGEARLRRHDGLYRWFLLRAQPLHDESGRIVKWHGVNIDIDDRKIAEQALAINERSLKQAIDRFPANLSFVTGTGANVSLSQHFWDFTGLTPDPAHPTQWLDAYHPEDREPMLAKFTSFRISGEGGEVEGRLRRFDGAYRWFQIRTRPVHDDSGQVVRWYSVGVDIEDRKNAEQALAESERDLKAAIDQFPAMLWFTDGQGNKEMLNQHFWDFTGLSPDDPSPTGWYAAFHPDELPSVGKKFQALLETGKVGDVEARLRRFDGVYRLFLLRSFPSRDATGRIVRWYGVGTDIEDRKRAEADLQRALRDLNEAQKLSRTGSYANDYASGEHLWSEELYRMFEFEPGSQITSEAALAAVHPDDRAGFAAAFEKSANDGTDIDLNYRIVTVSGQTKHLHTVAHISGWEEKRPIIIGAVQDITDTRLAEAALDRARSELAHASRAMSLGVLTASIAHEVNQPLSGIITNADTCVLMLSAEPPQIDVARETALRTIRDGKRASEVISRLRALFGRKEFAAETVDLNEAAREVIALSSHELHRQRIDLRTRFAHHLPQVIGDRVQLQQVIINLVLNAADAVKGVDAASRQIFIETALDGSNTVRLTVQDTGTGLAPDALAKIFDAFYTTKADGMGIGLSVSRSIVERHGGRLWATQNEGPGATFSFSIPLPGGERSRNGGSSASHLSGTT